MNKSFLTLISLLALSQCVALAGCGGDNARPTSTATGSLSATPSVAAASFEELERAARLYEEGSVEEATRIYEDTIEDGDDPERQQAQWALARLHYQQGDNGKAEDTVEEYLDEEIAPDAERSALLLKGTVEFAQGRNGEAEESLKAYVAAGGPAAAYATLRLADLSARRGETQPAIEQTQAALGETLPPGVETDARFALASYYKDAGNVAAALDSYELLGLEGEFRSERAEALWQAAGVAIDAGDVERGLRSLRMLLAIYPAQAKALEALDDPRFAQHIGLPSRALVLFQHRVNDQAAPAYQAIVDSGDAALAADAQYHLGILAERVGNYDEAITRYDASIGSAAATGDLPTVGQALWDKATVFELLGRTDEAAQTFVSIIDAAPASERAPEGLFRGGLLRFRQGLAAEAAAIWGRQQGFAADGAARARAYYWAAKAERSTGNEAGALALFQEAAALPDLDYYALRAKAQIGGQGPRGAAAEIRSAAPDWGKVEEWLSARLGPENSMARTTFFTGPAHNRAIELLRAGLRADAELEFEQMIEDAGESGWLLYRLSRELLEERLYEWSAQAALRFVPLMADTPPAAVAMAYPAVFPEIVNREAADNGFSPFLLLGLVRQESFYDPRAVSPADASGLTQVIPTTAEGIAEALEEDDFRYADIFRPRVSLRFGAYYLGTQIAELNADIPAALSAYNGGPGNAVRWQEAGGGDPDVFLESIEFEETRAYVELVLEHYAAYLYAYEVTSAPSLPL
jgi:soluble lytic murein transglycosylase